MTDTGYGGVEGTSEQALDATPYRLHTKGRTMSIFNQIATAVTGSANNRVEVAMSRFSTAMERIAQASERMADDTERVASATEKVAHLNALRLGLQQANDFLVRIENVDGELVIESNNNLAALLAPVVPVLALVAPAEQTEETQNEGEQRGHPTPSGKPCRKRKPCRNRS